MPSGDEATRQRSASAPLPPGGATALAVVVSEGPDKGARLFFDDTLPPRVLIGTSPLCTLVLTDREVSRRHLALTAIPAGLELEDLGSTNGTFVSGVRVRACSVRGGQLIELGSTRLRVIQVPVAAKAGGEPVPAARGAFGRLLGQSAIMQRIFALCERAAASSEPVLIEGETGAGKELLAECLHEASGRAGGPFVVVDCAGLTPAEADALLFGVPGAPGLIEQAQGGTLMLDEVTELGDAVQAKLGGVLARRALRRAGTTDTTPIDVRVLATSRKDVDREVELGHFRADLVFRLAVLRLELPPLRARPDDVRLLGEHFWRSSGTDEPLPPDLVTALDGRGDWPGNVRELENLVARRRALGAVKSLPVSRPLTGADAIEAVLEANLTFPSARERVLAEFEQRFVARALAAHGGNVARAAAASGIARRYFQIIKARQPVTTEGSGDRGGGGRG